MADLDPQPRATGALLGDPLPGALARYYEALDDGRPAEAAACFGPSARYATPPTAEDETAARIETVGAAALSERLVARGHKPRRHVPELCVVEGAVALLEGVLHDETGRPAATFVASARVGDGTVDRYLAYMCNGARDPIPTDLGPDDVPADAATVLHDYFAALDEGRFADAAACFREDTLYSHPPYRHTGIDSPGRIEFRGRAALEAAFHQRGRTSFDHDLLACVQRGPHCLVEGVVRGLADGGTGSFISSLSLAGNGTIRRYVSFYCEPGVPVA
jgi:SnoaL-like domain